MKTLLFIIFSITIIFLVGIFLSSKSKEKEKMTTVILLLLASLASVAAYLTDTYLMFAFILANLLFFYPHCLGKLNGIEIINDKATATYRDCLLWKQADKAEALQKLVNG